MHRKRRTLSYPGADAAHFPTIQVSLRRSPSYKQTRQAPSKAYSLASTKFSDVDAWREFICNILPFLTRHIKRTIPSLLSHPPLLAHTIYQAITFDVSLREAGFSMSRTLSQRSVGDTEWQGISEVILGRKEWFDRWVEGEKTFVLDRYYEILGAKDAWTIVNDTDETGDLGSDNNDLQYTMSARQLKSLVEQVTDRYSPLPNFAHRTRFLVDVQLPLLEGYHGRISSSLDAFESLSSTIVRAVPGALGAASNSDTRNRGHPTAGVEGIMRLCKALVSGRYISNAMEGWGDDLCFLELWTEINHKASLRARAEMHPSLPDSKNSSQDAIDGTIFEELVQQYEKLGTRTEDMIVQQVCAEVETAWKIHLARFALPTSSHGRDCARYSDVSISPTLLPALSALSSHLSLLRRTLPRAPTRRAQILQRESELWVETCRIALLDAGERIEAGRILGANDELWEQILKLSFDDLDQEWGQRITESIDGADLSRRKSV
ncbi:TIP-1 family-domain-containing protein [Lactarius quietus]|nr:TIP-1 family-domain-containing protein [Lactarius quietus]